MSYVLSHHEGLVSLRNILKDGVCTVYVHLKVKDTHSTKGIVAWRVISKQILLRP
jgi:methionine-rich copper-binding protein CopC